jgi:DNA-binding NarL/FixJ family response regulator
MSIVNIQAKHPIESGDGPMSLPKRVVIVDAEPAACEALAANLQRQADLTLAGIHGSPTGLPQALADYRADVVVTDAWLKGAGGLELIKNLSSASTRVVVWSLVDDKRVVTDALHCGAQAYVSKYQGTDDVVTAIRLVCNGGRYLPDGFTATSNGHQSANGDARFSQIDQLSQRERTVFEMLGDGSEMSEIAGRLGVSVKTVETYRARIKQKLNIKGRAKLVCFAVEWALERRRSPNPCA